jgi:hypothetical protein
MEALQTHTDPAPSADLEAGMVLNSWLKRSSTEQKVCLRSVVTQIKTWLDEPPTTPLHISHTDAFALPDLAGPWTSLQHLVVTDCKNLSGLPSPYNAPAVQTLRLHGCDAYGAGSNLHLTDASSCAAFLKAAHAISVWEAAAPESETAARLAIAKQLRLALVDESQGRATAPWHLASCPGVSSLPEWLPKDAHRNAPT